MKDICFHMNSTLMTRSYYFYYYFPLLIQADSSLHASQEVSSKNKQKRYFTSWLASPPPHPRQRAKTHRGESEFDRRKRTSERKSGGISL